MVIIYKSKKGDVQVSLSWVFMIIIGTLFLVLAYNIIGKYKHIEEQKLELEVKHTLRTIMNNVGRTVGVENSKVEPLKDKPFQNSKVEIICEGGTNILSLNDNLDANNQYLNSYPVFMTYIEQNDIDFTYMVVESFKLPFKTTSLLAFVSQKNLIVFDTNSKMANKIVTKFNKGGFDDINYIAKDFSNSVDLINLKEEVDNPLKYNSIMFVTDKNNDFETDLSEYNKDLRVYKLEFNIINKQYGNLTYIDRNKNNYTYTYFDIDESLSLPTIALFSAPGTFNCSYDRLIENTISTYQFYLNKTNYIMEIANNSLVCSSNFEDSTEYIFQKYKYEALFKNLNDSYNLILQENFTNGEELSNLLNKITSAQKILESENCIYVY